MCCCWWWWYQHTVLHGVPLHLHACLPQTPVLHTPCASHAVCFTCLPACTTRAAGQGVLLMGRLCGMAAAHADRHGACWAAHAQRRSRARMGRVARRGRGHQEQFQPDQEGGACSPGKSCWCIYVQACLFVCLCILGEGLLLQVFFKMVVAQEACRALAVGNGRNHHVAPSSAARDGLC